MNDIKFIYTKISTLLQKVLNREKDTNQKKVSVQIINQAYELIRF